MKEAVSKIPTWIVAIGTVFFLFLIVDSAYISKRPIMIFGQEFGFKAEKADAKNNKALTKVSNEGISKNNLINFNKSASYHIENKERMELKNKESYYKASKGLGIVTENNIPLKNGTEIEFFIKADYDFGTSPDGIKWRIFFNIGLLENSKSDNSETLKDLASEFNSIIFSLAPNPEIQHENKEKLSKKSKRSEHTLLSSYEQDSTSYFKVFHEPNKWNKITLTFVENNIKLYINNKLAIDYSGKFPSEAFLSIHEDHTSMSYSIKKNMLINYNHKVLNIKP